MSNPDSRRPARKRDGQPKPALDAVLNDAAGDPLRRAMQLETLGHLWRTQLPANLQAHLRLANVSAGCVSVLADGPAWAARARLASDHLLQAARSLGLEASRLRVRVAIPAAATHPVREKRPTAAAKRAVDEALRLLRKD